MLFGDVYKPALTVKKYRDWVTGYVPGIFSVFMKDLLAANPGALVHGSSWLPTQVHTALSGVVPVFLKDLLAANPGAPGSFWRREAFTTPPNGLWNYFCFH